MWEGRGLSPGLFSDVVVAVLVRELVGSVGTLTSSHHVLLVAKQAAVGTEVGGQHLSGSTRRVDCLDGTGQYWLHQD